VSFHRRRSGSGNRLYVTFFFQRISDLAQDIITDIMPESIVEYFESIQIHHDYREWAPRMAGMADRLIQRGSKDQFVIFLEIDVGLM
jgi:hypothetical protein